MLTPSMSNVRANVSRNSLAGNFHVRDWDTRKDTISIKKIGIYPMMPTALIECYILTERVWQYFKIIQYLE